MENECIKRNEIKQILTEDLKILMSKVNTISNDEPEIPLGEN